LNGFEWGGIKIFDLKHIPSFASTSFDLVYSWNEPDTLRPFVNAKLRMCNLQINSFDHSCHGYDEFVDIWTSPSESHRQVIGAQSPDPSKWHVITNGVDIESHVNGLNEYEKDHDTVLWASSPDRGLHNLLQIWPRVKNEIPSLKLRVLYKFDRWLDTFTNSTSPFYGDLVEHSHRAFYVKEAMRRFEKTPCDVEFVGSVSRKGVLEEMTRAAYLAYPCDTISYTEGFSVSIMEACASKTIPIISDQDALKSLYAHIVPSVASPVSENLDQYANLLIETIRKNDQSKRDELHDFASKFDWSVIAGQVLELVKFGHHQKSIVHT
jgi:glycosyltransferase involved in cell wall biosynthesis